MGVAIIRGTNLHVTRALIGRELPHALASQSAAYKLALAPHRSMVHVHGTVPTSSTLCHAAYTYPSLLPQNLHESASGLA